MNTPLIGRKVQFPTRVLCFRNIIRSDELEDEEEFKDILEDIREECAKFGRVMSINIPRTDQSCDINVIGNAFVEFYTIEESKEARRVNGFLKSNFQGESSTGNL